MHGNDCGVHLPFHAQGWLSSFGLLIRLHADVTSHMGRGLRKTVWSPSGWFFFVKPLSVSSKILHLDVHRNSEHVDWNSDTEISPLPLCSTWPHLSCTWRLNRFSALFKQVVFTQPIFLPERVANWSQFQLTAIEQTAGHEFAAIWWPRQFLCQIIGRIWRNTKSKCFDGRIGRPEAGCFVFQSAAKVNIFGKELVCCFFWCQKDCNQSLWSKHIKPSSFWRVDHTISCPQQFLSYS